MFTPTGLSGLPTQLTTLQVTLLGPLLFILAAGLLYYRTYVWPYRHLPPGPPGHFLWGNMYQVPKSRPWVQMAKWSEEYGPIYTIWMGPTKPVLIVGSAEIANELLDKRGSIWSSRPRMIMTSELVSRGLRMTFMPFTDRWKAQRKLLHTMTQPRAATTYEPIQDQESRQLIRDTLLAPQDYWSHCQRYAGSTIMQIAFNKRAETISDPAIVDMRRINEQMTQTAVPGRFLVDSLPILNLIPERFAPFKQQASALFEDTLRLFRSHVEDVYREVKSGSDVNCFAKTILESKDKYDLTNDEATFLAGAMYGAGSDTTADMISTAIMTFTKYPDLVARAQAELDNVVGHDRLPDFADESDLVYCSALVREIMRWRTVIAGGLAHASIKDDFYEGYHIPAGTTLIPNHWSIHLDPKLYPEPETCNPERFIRDGKLVGTAQSDRGHHSYGFGRRICPGMYIADRSMFITFTRLLWAFTFKEDPAHPIDIDSFSEGFSSHPLHFKTGIAPRGPWVEEALKSES
ncbi:hypothetical protein NliqN6_3036 [Naganishia liquefaciens]|uniref:Cytochrome P450 n=1 Tax=Naganishia liquefaciens TaxID=104408 RepID=A0A8H3YEM5_9TREE|nr:hypothetical protein NliqN6_3036 [Naganishia liquefaciens]